jgi:hypothetical protein
MFCPSCGTEERHSNQFCRACGANLTTVRTILEKPDAVTDSAAKARDEIGSAFAQQIRQISKASELNKIAEEGLPYIEKFLESPEERRLRRIRTGSILAFIGLGAAIAFSIVGSIANEKLLVLAGLGVVCLFIGAAFLINGLLFSVPKKAVVDKSSEGENQRQLDYIDPETNGLKLPESNQIFSSVIEQTTRQLKQKQPIPRN